MRKKRKSASKELANLKDVVPTTLGAILREAREKKGIPIEMAAHHTRIRASRLWEIEADDLTHIPPSYARLILRHYSEYLGIPLSNIRDFLPEGDAFGVDGYQYIANAASDSPVPEPPRRGKAKSSALRTMAWAVLILLILGGVVQGVLVWKKIERARAVEDRAALEAGPETRYPESFVAIGDPSPSSTIAGKSSSPNSSTP